MPRRENARERILEAAESLVIEKGVDALTMDTIAMMTGLGKGGVLYHFNYKVDLMQGMIERYLDRMDKMLIESKLNEVDEAYDWIEAFIKSIFQDRDELHRSGIAVFAAASRYPKLLEPVRAYYERRQQEILSQVNDPHLVSIILLAGDGFGFFSGLSLSPILETDIEAVRERLLSMVDALRKADQK